MDCLPTEIAGELCRYAELSSAPQRPLSSPHCSASSNGMPSTDPAPSVDAEPCTSSHITSLIAAQPRTTRLSAPLSIPREETMRTHIRSQLVPAAACESAFAELCLQSPLCPKLVTPSPSSEHGGALSRRTGSYRNRCVLGAINRIGSGKVHPIPIHPPR